MHIYNRFWTVVNVIVTIACPWSIVTFLHKWGLMGTTCGEQQNESVGHLTDLTYFRRISCQSLVMKYTMIFVKTNIKFYTSKSNCYMKYKKSIRTKKNKDYYFMRLESAPETWLWEGF